MVKIRLAMNKKAHSFTVVVADSRSPRDGKFLGKVGMYNPRMAKDSENRLKLDLEQINKWIANGAQPTDTIKRLMKQVQK